MAHSYALCVLRDCIGMDSILCSVTLGIVQSYAITRDSIERLSIVRL